VIPTDNHLVHLVSSRVASSTSRPLRSRKKSLNIPSLINSVSASVRGIICLHKYHRYMTLDVLRGIRIPALSSTYNCIANGYGSHRFQSYESKLTIGKRIRNLGLRLNAIWKGLMEMQDHIRDWSQEDRYTMILCRRGYM